MAGDRSGAARSEWAAHWPIVLSAAVGCSVAGLHLHSMGLFIQPLEAGFGWSRSQISAALSISSVVGLAMALFVGLAVDRWGSRSIALAGLTLYIAAFAALGAVGPSIQSYWAIYTLLSVAVALIAPTVWTAAVARRFQAARGMAFALTLAGPSLCSFLIPLLTHWLISGHGWRMAYVGLAGMFGIVAIPLTLALFRDGHAGGEAQAARAESLASGRSRGGLGELRGIAALRSARYWRIAFAGLCTTSIIVGMTVHFIPFTTHAGLDRSLAALAAGFIGIASLAGRLLEGALIDRCSATLVSGISFLLPALAAVLALLFDGSLPMALLIAVALGMGLGAEYSLLAYLISRCFGTAHFGVLFGIVAAGVHLGAGLGPLLSGAAFDMAGGYAPFILGALLLSPLCSFIMFTLGPMPDPHTAP